MKKLPLIVMITVLIASFVAPLSAWEFKQGPCYDIKIDMSREKVELSAVKLAVLVKMGVLKVSAIASDCTGLNLVTRPDFNPWDLESQYLVGVAVHALRVRPQANEVILGVDGLPLFIFTYHREYGKLCCKGVKL